MDTYLLLKTVHILGAMMFVGNIAVTAWWKTAADHSGDAAVIAFAQRQVALTDWVFTLGGALLVGAAGVAAAWVGRVPFSAPWLIWGEGLFTASGLVWLTILVPLQRRLGRITRTFAPGAAIPPDYWRLERWWRVFGVVAVLLPLAVVPLMVWKPA